MRVDLLNSPREGRLAPRRGAGRLAASSRRRPRTTARPDARTSARSPPRRGRRRRRQREWAHAVHGCRARGRGQRRSADRVRRLRPRLRARGGRRAPDRRRRRSRVPRRLDAAQGRDRAEARAEHALDDLDGPAREDVRQPHGRRRRDATRSCGRACDGSCAPRRAPRPDEVDAALAAADGEAKVAIVSLLAGIDADEARARLDDAGQSIRLAVER